MLLFAVSILYFVSFNLFTFKHPYDAVAGFAVTVRVYGFAHSLVCDRVVKQGADFADNEVVVGANKVDGAALEGFGTLGGIAHHEDGLA